MKHPKLRLNKKLKITAVRKLKIEITELVHDALLDIEKYIVNDVIQLLKKRGIVYAEDKKENSKKKKIKKQI